ncbi:hypothetical protein GNI_222070 [Gregarina niphandrodes]|uniref:Uncharacterized protein n=1 Tax=Gregarina niphandrodes TaxID=110365 RepID=A0A023AVN9_GRENI|nr:hypothetical protein GNI_222070 [Gregarina niphandrodes]EZG42811.1 hypothetical protein GNI_222070 [Gregarina niphandrodes]|eukprot:XP_011133911.1 hypothetical protein GNI_222070 [Gregarina niphandrodes]
MVQTRANTNPEEVYNEFFRKCKEEKFLDMELFQLIPTKLIETRTLEKKIHIEDLYEIRDKYMEGTHPSWAKQFRTMITDLQKKMIPPLDLKPLLTTREFRDANKNKVMPTLTKQPSNSLVKSYVPPPMPQNQVPNQPPPQMPVGLDEMIRDDSSGFSSVDSGPRQRHDEPRYGFEVVEDIENLMFDPMSLILQLKQKKASIPKLFEMKLRVISQAIYHPSIENTEQLIDALDTIRREGVISYRQKDRLLISIVAYGKDATLKRLESGMLDRPLNIYAKSSRKKPNDGKTSKKTYDQKPQGNTQANGYKGRKPNNNKNRRGSYKTTETTNNWSDNPK